VSGTTKLSPIANFYWNLYPSFFFSSDYAVVLFSWYVDLGEGSGRERRWSDWREQRGGGKGREGREGREGKGGKGGKGGNGGNGGKGGKEERRGKEERGDPNPPQDGAAAPRKARLKGEWEEEGGRREEGRGKRRKEGSEERGGKREGEGGRKETLTLLRMEIYHSAKSRGNGREEGRRREEGRGRRP
jgi:hypothetical protein